ncbi:TPA: terminase, partial [Escherichia coli]
DAVLTQATTDSEADLSVYTAMLDELNHLVSEQDMPDQVRSKLHKARAFSRRASSSPDDLRLSLNLLREAMRINPASGVKREIATLERAVRKLADGNQVVPASTTGRKTTTGGKKSSAKKKSAASQKKAARKTN